MTKRSSIQTFHLDRVRTTRYQKYRHRMERDSTSIPQTRRLQTSVVKESTVHVTLELFTVHCSSLRCGPTQKPSSRTACCHRSCSHAQTRAHIRPRGILPMRNCHCGALPATQQSPRASPDDTAHQCAQATEPFLLGVGVPVANHSLASHGRAHNHRGTKRMARPAHSK